MCRSLVVTSYYSISGLRDTALWPCLRRSACYECWLLTKANKYLETKSKYSYVIGFYYFGRWLPWSLQIAIAAQRMAECEGDARCQAAPPTKYKTNQCNFSSDHAILNIASSVRTDSRTEGRQHFSVFWHQHVLGSHQIVLPPCNNLQEKYLIRLSHK